ncbi:MAG: TolC family protein [Treponema sp.]|nr:TolC family protein [Treponema sp.]
MKRVILIFSIFIFASPGLFAQSINLEQARTLALANSRSLAKYNMAIRGSILDERNQLYSMLPSLSADYSASMSYLGRNWDFVKPADTLTAGFTFSVTQIIFEGGKSFIQKAIRSIATESIRKDALAEYFNVLDAVDNAYYAVLEASASLEAAESTLQTAALTLSIAEIRQANGIINQGDYLKALSDKEIRENSRNQARRNLALCMTRFNALTGLKESVTIEQVDFNVYENVIRYFAGISDEDADALYDRFIKILVASNPSLAKASLNSQRAERSLSLARRDCSPVISATIFSTTLQYSAADGRSNTTAGGVSIRGSIPIDFWVTANRIEKSRIERDSAALDYISAVNSLETELQSAFLNAFAQAESVLSSRRSLEYAERHFEHIMERYRLSQSSVSDLQEATSLLITGRNNLINASYGFLQSLSRLNSLGAIGDEEKLINILLN